MNRLNAKTRKIFTFVLCLIFVFQCLPFAAFAEGSSDSDDEQQRPVNHNALIAVTLTLEQQLTPTKRRYSINMYYTADVKFTKFTVASFKLYRGPSTGSGTAYSCSNIEQSFSPSVYGGSMISMGEVTITADNSGNYKLYAVTTNAKMKFVSPYSWENIPNLNFETING